ncbi:MAG TPA: RNA 2',3'-cyclic phosphodiesterase [Caulobacteraceae bacterium]|jgi:2'-5' RNA ligase|nr:RNA 2',3'-cyclic phosphodiesterase [Caulobacteraceae bacterium]
MIRLFAALAPPPQIAEALASRQSGLAGAAWRPVEALHVTLRFFGEMPETTADDLDAELTRVGGAPLTIELQGVGAFADGADIHAVWAGVAENPALGRLARRCETAARRAGLKPETRSWRPHLTLAYLNRAEPAAVAAWTQANNLLRSPPFRIDAFGLYSSRRGVGGSRYRLERSYRLAG